MGKLPREEPDGIVTRCLLASLMRPLEFGLSHNDFACSYVIYTQPRSALGIGLNRIWI